MDRRRFIVLGTAGSIAVLTGCGGGGGEGASMPGMGDAPPPVPPPATPPVTGLTKGQPLAELPRLVNVSATAGAFEATLVAERTTVALLPGTTTEFWSYNSKVPGPLIDVFEGDTVRIRLDNHLSQETTVHWHGLPVPPAQDGNPMDPIAPGASRTYEFTLPMGSAGTYWYHPHPHELTAEQVFRGMAGLLIVRSRTDPVPAAIEEKLLVISDLRLAADGTIPANTPMDWQNGREGNYVLVNGQYQPVLTIKPGQSQRWRILNATNARYLRLALTGHTMTLIGTDGGLLRAPVPGLNDILLAPAERVEVIVTASLAAGVNGGATKPAVRPRRRHGHDGSVFIDDPAADTQLHVRCNGCRRAAERAQLHCRSRGPDDDQTTGAFVGHGDGRHGRRMMSFLIDGKIVRSGTRRPHESRQRSRAMDDREPFQHGPPVPSARHAVPGGEPHAGRRRRWPSHSLAWRDIVNVAALETVVFKVVQRQLGKRMYHCHILEHERPGHDGRAGCRRLTRCLPTPRD